MPTPNGSPTLGDILWKRRFDAMQIENVHGAFGNKTLDDLHHYVRTLAKRAGFEMFSRGELGGFSFRKSGSCLYVGCDYVYRESGRRNRDFERVQMAHFAQMLERAGIRHSYIAASDPSRHDALLIDEETRG